MMNDQPHIEISQALTVPAGFGRLGKVPFWSCVIVSLISVSVLLGWSFEIDFLKRIIPGYVFMNPTTAVTFILASIALWLVQGADSLQNRVVQICAAVVATVGLIKLCALFGFFDIGIDRILFASKSLDNVSGELNRMAPNTAVNFLLFGAALLLFNLRSNRKDFFPAQYPAMLVFLSSFVAIIGYLYGAESFIAFNPMAIHTAFSFLLLSVGLLLSRREQGLIKEVFSRHPGGRAARRLLPWVIVIPLVLGWLRLYGEKNGFYKAETGTAILIVSILLVFVLIILNNARLMNKSSVEHEQTVQALNEATKRELAVIRNALDVICTIDAQGNFASINPACFRMWGYQPAELIGRSYVDLVVPEDVAKTIESTASNMSGEELTDFENRYRHKDGTIVNLMWTSHWSESEQLMFAVAHNITERKNVEVELKDFAARLERSNSELQDFASVAAHDLQEPLRKVQAFGDRLKAKCGDALTEAGLDYLERMQKAAGRMQVLIEDLMTFSRVTTQAQPFVPVDLQLVAEEVLSDLEMRIETSNGRVEISKLATIDADPTQMRQLLQNLISNALKFNRPGIPPVVKVGGQFLENNSGNANEKSTGAIYRLTVEDNGIGFESKYVDRIFKVFQRLHGRTEYEGTGIGLAVCRKITERHGGDITVKSVPGEGTIFIADLPIKQLGEKLNNE